MFPEYKSLQKQHYHCVAKYHNDMGHFLIKLFWESETPKDVIEFAENPIQNYIYKLAQSHTTEFFKKIPGKQWSTHHFKAEQPMTSHELEIGGSRFHINIAWGI